MYLESRVTISGLFAFSTSRYCEYPTQVFLDSGINSRCVFAGTSCTAAYNANHYSIASAFAYPFPQRGARISLT